MPLTYATSQRLLELPDTHRALLAEYDFYPAHNLLYVRWHGHLTAAAVVRGAQAGLDLFRNQPLPRRVLSNHSQATGSWEDAIPWLHYEWLPQATERGLMLLAHVVSPDASEALTGTEGGLEFIEVLHQELLVRSFRTSLAAWQWATTR